MFSLPPGFLNSGSLSDFIDLSSNAFALTPIGAVALSTGGPYGDGVCAQFGDLGVLSIATGSAVQFDGSLNPYPMTMEGWIYAVTGTWPQLIKLGGESASRVVSYLGTGRALTLNRYGAADLAAGGVVPLSTWTHFAVSASSTTTLLFLAGTQVASATRTSSAYGNNGGSRIGPANNAGTGIVGKLSGVRISKTQRYATGFTPSTTRFTVDSDTVVLTNF